MDTQTRTGLKKVIYTWAFWVLLSNIAFLALLAGLKTFPIHISLYIPTSVWLYLAVISVIAVGNWVLGWHFMRDNNGGEK